MFRTTLFAAAFATTLATAAPTLDTYNTLRWNRNAAGFVNATPDRGDWYEWWYYKVVLPGSPDAFYFVYGIVNPWDVEQSRAASSGFLGFGDFGGGRTFEERFPVNQFAARYDRAEVKLGEHAVATDRALSGELKDEYGETVARWNLTIDRDWSFHAMGWGEKVKGISNIYWYPAQASARMSGTIEYNGRSWRLDDAPAYQDRNWGRSMPKWWTWIVSNHFDNSPGTALAVGGGRPLFLEKHSVKDGMTIGLKHAGREYVFRTPDGDSITTDIRFGNWDVTATHRSGLSRVRISAYAPPEKFLLLKFTAPTGEVFNDYEALKGHVQVELETRLFPFGAWSEPVVLTSDEAGIEWGSFEAVEP